jgi:hypothetical protein
MANGAGARWHCPNRDCNWSVVALAGEEEAAPRCVCGNKMKMGGVVPAFRYLDFLKGEAGITEEAGIEKEQSSCAPRELKN